MELAQKPLVDSQKILLLPLHVKLGIVNNFVKAMGKNRRFSVLENSLSLVKQCNDSPQVLVSRQTGNSIERDNFSAMYLSNCYSWNYKLF